MKWEDISKGGVLDIVMDRLMDVLKDCEPELVPSIVDSILIVADRLEVSGKKLNA